MGKTTADRFVRASDIVGMIEVAARTGSTPHAVWNWTKRKNFPAPIARVSNKPVFDWAEVDAWNQNWIRSKGGFHTHKTQRTPAKKKVAPKRPPKKVAAKKTTTKAAVKKTTKRTVTRSPMARARRTA